MNEKIIYLERKYAIHSLKKHRLRSLFYKILIWYYEKTK